MDEALIRKTMPHSVEAEQSVVGSMMIDSEAVQTASEIITADDFYGKQYGQLFQAMVDLYTEGKPVDLVTLTEKLKQMDVPEELSSIDFIRELFASVPTSANVKYYAKIVKEKATLRKLIKVTEDIANKIGRAHV